MDGIDLQQRKRQAVLDYLSGNQETPEIPSAVGAESKRAQLISGLGRALEDFGRAESVARGGARTDAGFYEGIAKSGMASDQAKRQAVLDSLKQKRLARGDKLSEIETLGKLSTMQQDEETASRESDPNSQESMLYRDLASKLMPGRDFSGATAAQLKQAVPVLQKMYDLNLRAQDRAEDKAYKQEMLDIQRANLQRRGEEAQIKREEIQKEKQEKKEQARQEFFVPGRGYALTKDDAKKLKEAIVTKESFDSKLEELIKLRTEFGGEVVNREAVARAKQLSKDLLLAYKNIAKLGVLSRSDEDIINAIIPSDPLEFRSPLAAAQGQDPILNNLKKFKIDTDNDFEAQLQTRLEPDSRIDKPKQNTFPMQVRSADGRIATVSNEEELREAMAEGFNP